MSKTKGTTKAGPSILQGAREALAFARGIKNDGCVVHVPEEIDVKAIRKQTRMSQSEFSRSYGFSKRSLEQWEQGRRAPTGAARVFLTVIAREPEAVQRALIDRHLAEGLEDIRKGRTHGPYDSAAAAIKALGAHIKRPVKKTSRG
jgi:putative transcriptional regulator